MYKNIINNKILNQIKFKKIKLFKRIIIYKELIHILIFHNSLILFNLELILKLLTINKTFLNLIYNKIKILDHYLKIYKNF